MPFPIDRDSSAANDPGILRRVHEVCSSFELLQRFHEAVFRPCTREHWVVASASSISSCLLLLSPAALLLPLLSLLLLLLLLLLLPLLLLLLLLLLVVVVGETKPVLLLDVAHGFPHSRVNGKAVLSLCTRQGPLCLLLNTRV